MAYRKNSNLHKLAYALEKRADFLEDAKEWIADNPELAAGLLGGGLGAGAGALVPTGEEGTAGTRVRNALIGALLGGGLGTGAGYLGRESIQDLMGRGPSNWEKVKAEDVLPPATEGETYFPGVQLDVGTPLGTDALSQLKTKGNNKPITKKDVDQHNDNTNGGLTDLNLGAPPSWVPQPADPAAALIKALTPAADDVNSITTGPQLSNIDPQSPGMSALVRQLSGR